MENKNHIMMHNTRFLNNGKIAQNFIVKSTQIKSTKIKNMNVTNGKLFTQELTIALQKNNIAIDTQSEELLVVKE